MSGAAEGCPEYGMDRWRVDAFTADDARFD
jgi:hypothetical protein